jgi:hypothetical protein
MRTMLAITVIALVPFATPVWGQPAMIADENGTVVFGANPAQVEVVNLPEPAAAPQVGAISRT